MQTQISIGIIGAGKGGRSLLHLLNDIPHARVVAVCEIDPNAPGLKEAERQGVAIFSNLEQMVQSVHVDWIFNVAGSSATRRFLLTREMENVVVIDGQSAEMGWRMLLGMYDTIIGPRNIAVATEAEKRFFSTLVWVVVKNLALSAGPMRKEMADLAFFDTLTKLYSRRILYEFLSHEVLSSIRSGVPLSVILLDIDNFKRVNDKFGHDMGDKVLVDFAHVLKTTHRKSDLAARYGGEEFVVIMPGVNCSDAAQKAEILRAEINAQVKDPESKPMSASLGVADLGPLLSRGEFDLNAPPVSDLVGELLTRADKAMYTSKQSGKNRVTIFQP